MRCHLGTRRNATPSQNFLARGVNEWQVRTILKSRKSLSPYNRIKFGLGLLLYVRIKQHCHEKRLHSRGALEDHPKESSGLKLYPSTYGVNPGIKRLRFFQPNLSGIVDTDLHTWCLEHRQSPPPPCHGQIHSGSRALGNSQEQVRAAPYHQAAKAFYKIF